MDNGVSTPREIDVNNQCFRCSIRGGQYIKKDTKEKVGVFLLKDSRGFMICNICKDAGFFVGKTKLTKKAKKEIQMLRRALMKMKNIPHVTLDAQGKEVK